MLIHFNRDVGAHSPPRFVLSFNRLGLWTYGPTAVRWLEEGGEPGEPTLHAKGPVTATGLEVPG